MPSLTSRIRSAFGRPVVAPTKEAGTSGTAVHGGYVENRETNATLTSHSQRYKTAADILINISAIAASVRYFVALVANPDWGVKAVNDTPEAQEKADFVKSVQSNLASSWTRIIRRTALYRFYGFGVQEWTAIKREDGYIGFTDLESRPQHTIERWEVDDEGRVTGMIQTSPQDYTDRYLPRWKCVYLVDDAMTDSPEGMGWFRNLVEPAVRLKEYLRLEKIGYERDLNGTPVGRAPIAKINEAVETGHMTAAQAAGLITGLENFVKMQLKQSTTGIILDSQPFENQTADGAVASSIPQWGIDLLTSTATSVLALDTAIKRLNVEMARIIGTENIFTGADGIGSLALAKDKSTNLYLNVNSTLDEMVEQFNRDFIGPLWQLNGFDPALRPSFFHADVSDRDVTEISQVLRDMATAGAVMAMDDPAIDVLRELLGLPPQDPMMPLTEPPVEG